MGGRQYNQCEQPKRASGPVRALGGFAGVATLIYGIVVLLTVGQLVLGLLAGTTPAIVVHDQAEERLTAPPIWGLPGVTLLFVLAAGLIFWAAGRILAGKDGALSFQSAFVIELVARLLFEEVNVTFQISLTIELCRNVPSLVIGSGLSVLNIIWDRTRTWCIIVHRRGDDIEGHPPCP